MALASCWIGYALHRLRDLFVRWPSDDLLEHRSREEVWAYILTTSGDVLVVNGVMLANASAIGAILGIWWFSIAMRTATGFDAAPVTVRSSPF